ncbi:hypothetical protein GS682_33035 [Nostoc sp. B(2019)]|nr:hypothetical protein [Nostoc sp. B(2019)]
MNEFILETTSKGEATNNFHTWLNKVKDNSNLTTSSSVGNFHASADLTFGEKSGNNLILRLTSLEGLPEDIRQIPKQEQPAIESFWDKLIENPALSDQLFAPLQTLRPDPNQLIPKLQFVIAEMRKQMSTQIPQSSLDNLDVAVREINITPPSPSIEEIFGAIKAELPKIESREGLDILTIINSLNSEAKSWLGRLLIYIVQNPDIEIDLRANL